MLKALIIDDERHAREFLKELLEKYFPTTVTILKLCSSVSEGIRAVRERTPDIVFLDIEMPQASGFYFIKSIGPTFNFDVVFVTAHKGYAFEAFKVHALDYLLKPINPEELKRTMEHIQKRRSANAVTYNAESIVKRLQAASKVIGIPTNEGIVFLNVSSIVRCEASSNYTVVYLENGKKMLVSRTLKEIEEPLIPDDFFRVHRSHLINLKKLSHYFKNLNYIELADGSKVPISRSLKDEFERRIVVI